MARALFRLFFLFVFADVDKKWDKCEMIMIVMARVRR